MLSTFAVGAEDMDRSGGHDRPEIRHLRQEARVGIAAAYVIALLWVANQVAGQLPPPLDINGLWFYTAFLPILLARFLIEPYFTRPADAVANGLGLLIGVVTLNPTGAVIPTSQLDDGRLAIGIYAGVTLAAAAAAMLGRDERSPFFGIGPHTTSLLSTFGRAEIGFSIYLGFLTLAAYATTPNAAGLIAAAWVTIMFIRPFEWVAVQVGRLAGQPRARSTVTAVGFVDPNLVLAALHSSDQVQVGDRIRWIGGAIGRVVDVTTVAAQAHAQVALEKPARVAVGERGTPERVEASGIVGYVAEGSEVNELVLRLATSADSKMETGRLLRATVQHEQALFQITDARIVERGESALRRQVAEVTARNLGRWNDTRRGFDQVAWVATPGTAVELVEASAPADTISGIGRVPGTSYVVGLKPSDLATHNTAILGILGVGKTSLAWELVQRMLADGIRVIAFDITGEYATRFGALFPPEEAAWLQEHLESQLAPTRNRTSTPKETAGNHLVVKPAFQGALRRFTDRPSSLMVINPAAFDVTIEDGFPAGPVVPLRRMAVPEVTRLLLESVLEFASGDWPPAPEDKLKARLCLVLEEAHSLVPEGGSTSDRAEANAAAKSARAVLQGRKFGVGCLLITQRTANVTKTILNQCHTVFAMRSFDSTSEQFLENYLGRGYASLLPSLRERQAIFFGRGSTSQSPVLIELNDREAFHRQWADRIGELPTTRLGDQPSAAPGAPREEESPIELALTADDLDDVPF
jgi:uncharacterized protein